MPIVFASNNPHKLREVREILCQQSEQEKQAAKRGGRLCLPSEMPAKLQVLSLADAGLAIDPEENADTIDGNAQIKARAVWQALKAAQRGGGLRPPSEASTIAVLADDTGLFCHALNGAPGVHTARYGGYQRLLEAMKGNDDRDAYFQTAMCYIDPQGQEHMAHGTVKGSITTEPRGNGGFGYDPVFQPTEANGNTFAQLTEQQKNALSHRARALKALEL